MNLGGFGRSGIDLRIRTMRCSDTEIIDKDCNLRIPSATITNLEVREDLLVRGNVEVGGVLKGLNGEKLKLGDTIVNGTMFSAEDEFTQIASSPSANVIIEPLPASIGSSLMISVCPCNGVINSVDTFSGNISYSFNNDAPPQLDVFQYKINDMCGINHTVTQLVCQEDMPAPFVNNACLSQRLPSNNVTPTTIGPLDLNPLVAGGKSGQIDWSSLTFKSLTSFTADAGNTTVNDCTDIVSFPYGTNEAAGVVGPGVSGNVGELIFTGAGDFSGTTTTTTIMHDGSGILNMIIDLDANIFIDAPRVEFFLLAELQVDNLSATPSNCFSVHFGSPVLLS